MVLKPGEVLQERYQVKQLLGEGGMGITYLAYDLRLGRECVLKTTNRIPDDVDRKRMTREAQLMADFNHPHLPTIFDTYNIDGDRPCIVMSFVSGETLGKRQSFNISDLLKWTDEILQALEYMHNKGIIHRDIHPGNICITSDNKAVLLDFGISRQLDQTRNELVAGVLNYGFAPIEQYSPEDLQLNSLCKAEKYVKKLHADGFHTAPYTDLYSLAATLYFLLTRHYVLHPSARVTSSETLTPITEFRSDVPIELVAVITTALAVHPQDRYQTATDMRRALQIKPLRKPLPGTPVIYAQQRKQIQQIDLYYIPQGEFLMGSDDSEMQPGKCFPLHPVTLTHYYISRHLITCADYQRFIDANPRYPVPTSHKRLEVPYKWDPDTRKYPPGHENLPVVLVSWNDARFYCEWLSRQSGQIVRLPTEAEWEKAAGWNVTTRSKQTYPWGDIFVLGRCPVGQGTPFPAGQFSPAGDSPFGMADMVGNVWQWTSSLGWSYPYALDQRRDKKDYDGRRVLRGGAFNEQTMMACCSWRSIRSPYSKANNIGFRIAANLN